MSQRGGTDSLIIIYYPLSTIYFLLSTIVFIYILLAIGQREQRRKIEYPISYVTEENEVQEGPWVRTSRNWATANRARQTI